MKFRVHAFRHVRYAYEVEADSIEEAYGKVDDLIADADPVDVELMDSERDDHVLVDPLDEDGEVIFEQAKWFGGSTTHEH